MVSCIILISIICKCGIFGVCCEEKSEQVNHLIGEAEKELTQYYQSYSSLPRKV